MSTDPKEEARLLALTVSKRLKALLEEGEVQSATTRAGVPFDQVARLRRGQSKNPTLRTVVMAARAARVPTFDLLASPEVEIERPEPLPEGVPLERLESALKKLDEARSALASAAEEESQRRQDAEAALAKVRADRDAAVKRKGSTRQGRRGSKA